MLTLILACATRTVPASSPSAAFDVCTNQQVSLVGPVDSLQEARAVAYEAGWTPECDSGRGFDGAWRIEARAAVWEPVVEIDVLADGEIEEVFVPPIPFECGVD